MFISFFNVWYVTTNIENYIIINILLVIFLFPEKYFFDARLFHLSLDKGT